MKTLKIEWKHFEINGKTCDRCNKTGKNLYQSIKELSKPLLVRGIKIQLKETKLPENQMDKSNSILLNGIPIENLLSDVSILKNNSSSCGEITNNPCECRAVQINKSVSEDIPKDLITNAILKSVD